MNDRAAFAAFFCLAKDAGSFAVSTGKSG